MKKLISAALAALMLVTSGAVNAFAEDNVPAAGAEAYYQSAGALSAPRIVSTAKGRTYIKLRWNKVSGASGYKVYCKTSGGKYKCIKTLKGGSKLTYRYELLNSHTKYTFKVRAYKKSGGKTTYSKYSPAKSVTTKYGLGTNNYSNTNFTIGKIDRNWVCTGDYPGYGMDSVHFKRANTDEFFPPDFRMSVDILNKERWDMTLEDFVEYKIKSEADNYYPVYYKLIEYRKLDGCRCAVLKEDAEDSADYILLALKKHGLYSVIYSYPYDKADIYGKEIDTMVDSIKLTPEK